MEIWDLYDENRIATGETIERSQPIPEGRYNLMVYGCIFNSEGKMLIQQRQHDKKAMPDKWDLTVGGHTLAGENTRETMHRELLEELGIDIDFTIIRPHLTEMHPRHIFDYFLIVRDLDINSLTIQTEEVQAVRWADKNEVLAMIDSGEFIPYFKGLLDYFFEGHKQYGFQRIN